MTAWPDFHQECLDRWRLGHSTMQIARTLHCEEFCVYNALAEIREHCTTDDHLAAQVINRLKEVHT